VEKGRIIEFGTEDERRKGELSNAKTQSHKVFQNDSLCLRVFAFEKNIIFRKADKYRRDNYIESYQQPREIFGGGIDFFVNLFCKIRIFC
jgi:hypothetical protein